MGTKTARVSAPPPGEILAAVKSMSDKYKKTSKWLRCRTKRISNVDRLLAAVDCLSAMVDLNLPAESYLAILRRYGFKSMSMFDAHTFTRALGKKVLRDIGR